MEIENWLQYLPEGYSEGYFRSRKYSVSKTTFSNGKSCKVYASELGGTNFISFNFYRLKDESVLKPCEMPESKVLNFIKKYNKIE